MKIAHLNSLRVLEVVLRRGSFRAAGKELNVTSAAVGQQIRALEEYIDRPLFKRTSKGARPSEEALAVREKLGAAFGEIEEVVTLLKRRKHATRLAITLPKSLAENWLINHLSDFYRLNAEIDLRLDASNRMVDLAAEGFDFAIRYSAPPDASTYASEDLFADYVLPVCSPDFEAGYGLSGQHRSLAGVPLIHLPQRTPDPGWADWQTWCRTFGFTMDSRIKGPELTRVSSGLQAAISGQGLVLCGIVEAYHALNSGLVVTPFGPGRNCPGEYGYRILMTRGARLSALQSQFRDWVVDISRDFRRSLCLLLSE